jgi:hypothetical protein
MNFTYVLAGWEGSAHDGRVIRDAQQRGFRAPEGKYFLADAGYANKDMLLSPYRGVRYHLREISQVGSYSTTDTQASGTLLSAPLEYSSAAGVYLIDRTSSQLLHKLS